MLVPVGVRQRVQECTTDDQVERNRLWDRHPFATALVHSRHMATIWPVHFTTGAVLAIGGFVTATRSNALLAALRSELVVAPFARAVDV